MKSAGHDTRYGKNPFPCKRLHGFSANGAAPRGGEFGLVAESPVGLAGLAGRVGRAGDAVSPRPAQPLAAVRSGACEAVLRKQSPHPWGRGIHAAVIPTRPAFDTFRRFRPPRKEKEEQMQKRHCGWLPGWTSPYPTSIRQISSTQGVDLPRRPRSTPTESRLPTVTGKLSRRGGVGWRGAHGCRGQARDGSTASPPSDTSPPRTPRAALALALASAGAGCNLQRKMLGGLTSLYFSLISRRRSPKPWAVIGSGTAPGSPG